jgi:hypothetical protein
MTDARPFSVVCVADDSRTTERVDLVENTIVAFVMAENVPEAWRRYGFRQPRAAQDRTS